MFFKKLIYNITHKEIRRKIFFPTSNTSSIYINRDEIDFNKRDFLNLSNQIIKPYLNEIGFVGKDDIFVKEFDGFYNRIVIAQSKSGKALCINCEIKKKSSTDFDIMNISSFPTNFDFWKRLSPDQLDNWWFPSISSLKNNESLNEMVKLIHFEGIPFFREKNKILS